MKAIIALLSVCLCTTACFAGLFDALGLKKAGNAAGVPAAGLAALPEDQVIAGLKEALGKGVSRAVSQLGHEGGFLTNAAVKIPMPDKLKGVEKTLRTLKQEKLADEFVTSMNRAAEQAVPAGAEVFADALKNMSLEDAKSIVSGPKDAATQYFRRVAGPNLVEKFLPVVKEATGKAGVTKAYKQLVEKAGSANLLGSFGATLANVESLDVDAYVTQKATDGLFKVMADEEKRIRENPAARTTELLQKVFGK